MAQLTMTFQATEYAAMNLTATTLAQTMAEDFIGQGAREMMKPGE